MRLINRLLKAATVIVAVLVLLYLSDVDLTAALTGLGVGGLAIGFGAQKTIENLFGGIMVISDKPVNVGDVCRVGEFFGTVEDIGIRSTRIRTLDRTVVSVPNGQLASMSLENFALRDRIRFQHTVGLGRQTTADQLRHVLAQIRRLLDDSSQGGVRRPHAPGSSDSAAPRWTSRSSPTCSRPTRRRSWRFRKSFCSASWTSSRPAARQSYSEAHLKPTSGSAGLFRFSLVRMKIAPATTGMPDEAARGAVSPRSADGRWRIG